MFQVKSIEIDGKLIKKDGHDYLKEILNFPDYYGKNLDALYDCLTDIGIETEITIINESYVSDDIIETFIDAADENSFLIFKR